MSCKYKYKDNWYSKDEIKEILLKERGINSKGELIKPTITNNPKQAKITKENTTSIKNVKSKFVSPELSNWRIMPGPGGKDENWAVEYILDDNADIEFFDTEQEAKDFIKSLQNKKIGEKEYTSQAEINLKIAALKEVARKYPRSLITNKVVPIIPNIIENSEIQYSKIPFQESLITSKVVPIIPPIQLSVDEAVKPVGIAKLLSEAVFRNAKKHGVKVQFTNYEEIDGKVTFGTYNKSTNTIFLNRNYYTYKTYFHELSHPFITYIHSQNPELFKDLLTTAEETYPEIRTDLLRFPEYTVMPKSWIDEEVIVRVLEKEFTKGDFLKKDSLYQKFINFLRDLFSLSKFDTEGITSFGDLHQRILKSKVPNLSVKITDIIAARDLENTGVHIKAALEDLNNQLAKVRHNKLNIPVKTIIRGETVNITSALREDLIAKDTLTEKNLVSQIKDLEEALFQLQRQVRRDYGNYYQVGLTSKEVDSINHIWSNYPNIKELFNSNYELYQEYLSSVSNQPPVYGLPTSNLNRNSYSMVPNSSEIGLLKTNSERVDFEISDAEIQKEIEESNAGIVYNYFSNNQVNVRKDLKIHKINSNLDKELMFNFLDKSDKNESKLCKS